MEKQRFVYWAHTNKGEPSRVFKRKRDALAWGREVFWSAFIVEPIAIKKSKERIQYIRNVLGYSVTTA